MGKIIICDSCHAEFSLDADGFKSVTVGIASGKAEVVYFNCPICGEKYLVSILDKKGKYLQEKYITAMDKYNAALRKRISSDKLKHKLEHVEALREEALSYQKNLMEQYKNVLPESIFE